MTLFAALAFVFLLLAAIAFVSEAWPNPRMQKKDDRK